MLAESAAKLAPVGRRVTVVTEGVRPEGRNVAHVDTGSLAVGVYALRLETDGAAAVHRFMVAR